MTNPQRHRLIVFGSAAIAVIVVVAAAVLFGSYALALSALHNHNNLSVQQSCTHWDWVYEATAKDHTPALHEAVGRTLKQLKCDR